MKHDLAEKWDERLLHLQTQIAREPVNLMVWHWRGEARVLRFLLHRYGEIEPPIATEQAAVAGAPDDTATPPTSALEKSLLRLALLIPTVANKHSRPAPRERADILERIRIARDEGRQIEDEEESWRPIFNQKTAAFAEIRRNTLQLRESETARKQRARARKAKERERRCDK